MCDSARWQGRVLLTSGNVFCLLLLWCRSCPRGPAHSFSSCTSFPLPTLPFPSSVSLHLCYVPKGQQMGKDLQQLGTWATDGLACVEPLLVIPRSISDTPTHLRASSGQTCCLQSRFHGFPQCLQHSESDAIWLHLVRLHARVT